MRNYIRFPKWSLKFLRRWVRATVRRLRPGFGRRTTSGGFRGGGRRRVRRCGGLRRHRDRRLGRARGEGCASGVGGGRFDGAGGDTVRGKEHGDGLTGFGAEFLPGGAEALGESVGKKRVLRPVFGKVDAQTGGLGLDGAAIEADAGAGVLRGHADDRGFFDAVSAMRRTTSGM